MRKKHFIFFFFLICILILSGVNHLANKPQKVDTLTMAVISQPAMTLVYIAQEKGYFKEEGLEIEYKTYSSGRDTLTAMISGETHLAVAYDIPVVRKLYEGENLGIISTLHSSNQNFAIIGKKPLINNPAELAGKRIALTKGTATEYYLELILALNGIDRQSVMVVDLPFSELVPAFYTSKADAVVIFNPDKYEMINSNSMAAISILTTNEYTEHSLLVGRRDVISANDVAVSKLMKSLVRAESFLKSNNAQSQYIVSKKLENTNPETLLKVWHDYVFAPRLNHVLVMNLHLQALFYQELGIYPQSPPNMYQFLMTDYLYNANPNNMTI